MIGDDGGLIVTSVNIYRVKEAVLCGVVVILRCSHVCFTSNVIFFSFVSLSVNRRMFAIFDARFNVWCDFTIVEGQTSNAKSGDRRYLKTFCKI